MTFSPDWIRETTLSLRGRTARVYLKDGDTLVGRATLKGDDALRCAGRTVNLSDVECVENGEFA